MAHPGRIRHCLLALIGVVAILLLPREGGASEDAARRALSLRYFDRVMGVVTDPDGFRTEDRSIHLVMEIGLTGQLDGSSGVPGIIGGSRHGEHAGFHLVAFSPEMGRSGYDILSAGLYAYPGPLELAADVELFPSQPEYTAARLRFSHDPLLDSTLTLTTIIGSTDRWTEGAEGDGTIGPVRFWARLSLLGRVHLGSEVDYVSRQLRFPISTSLWHLLGARNLPQGRGDTPLFNARLRTVLTASGPGVEAGPSILVIPSRMGEGGGYLFATGSYYPAGYFESSGLGGDDLGAFDDIGQGFGIEIGLAMDTVSRFAELGHIDPFDQFAQISLWYNAPEMAWNGSGQIAGMKARFLY